MPSPRRSLGRRRLLGTAAVGLVVPVAVRRPLALGCERGCDRAASIPCRGDAGSDYLRRHRFLCERSPWNTEIAENVVFGAASGRDTVIDITSRSVTWGNVAIHFARADDPFVQVLFHPDTWTPVAAGRWRRSANVPEIEREILGGASSLFLYPGNPYSTQVAGLLWNSHPSGLPREFCRADTSSQLWAHIPRDAEPDPDSDGYTVIIQPDGRALELYAPVKLHSGTWISEMCSFTDALRGVGVGFDGGRRASMIPCYAGVIREIDLGRGRIDHALALAVPPALLEPSFVYPALAFDSDSSDYRGTLPMGTRLAPLPDDRSDTPPKTRLGAMITEAASRYGMFVVDRGGSGITVIAELSPALMQETWASPDLRSDLTDLIRRCRTVTPPRAAAE